MIRIRSGAFAQADLHGGPSHRGAKGQPAGIFRRSMGVPWMGWSRWPTLAGRGDGPQEALGVFVAGIVEDLVRRALLTDGAGVHDDDLVAHLGHDAKIVRDDDDRHAEFLLQSRA